MLPVEVDERKADKRNGRGQVKPSPGKSRTRHSDLETANWPFWKTVPRFERTYTIVDLMRSLGTLVGAREGVRIQFAHDLFPNVPAYFARNGRECLYLALKLLKMRPCSRVGVPLFCCGVVFEAVVAAGHVPVFLDVNLETYNLDERDLARKRHEIDALILPHMFGYPADLDRLRDSLSGRRVPIIEDCAHSLFSEYKGRPTGSFTEAAILSFGIHKPAEAGGGGMLLINDPNLAQAAAHELTSLPGQTRWHQLLHALRVWKCNVAYQRVTYGAALMSPLSRLIDRNYAASGGLRTDPAKLHWSPARISSMNQVLVDSSIGKFKGKVPTLAKNAQRLRDAILGSPLKIPCEPSYGKWNHFWVPVRYPNATQSEGGRWFLRNRRVDVSLIWPYCVRIGRRFGYRGGCQQAEEAANTVCRVPHYAWLSADEMEYIGQSLRASAGLD